MLKTLFKIGLWSVVIVAAISVVACVAIWRELTADLPPVADLLDYRPPTATRVYAADGSQIGEFYVERRYLVPIDQVPNHVKRAFLAAEDAEFYRHRGVSPMSIARALLANLESGEIVQGASTITQQVVKQLLLSNERTVERKVKELILALELESKLSKDDIFYLYLNHIYFGAGAYGISAAAQILFGKAVGELSLPEAALLAGLPQAPSRTEPFLRPEAAVKRQHHVLARMAAVGFITAEEREHALAEPLRLATTKPPSFAAAPWYVEHVRRLLEAEYGPEFADLGLHVQTAVDLRLQGAAEAALRDGLRTVERRLGVRNAVRHLPAKRIEAFLDRQRQSRSPDDPQQAVVTDVGAQQLEILTPWERGIVAAEGIGASQERTASTYRVGDVISVDPTGRGDDGVMRYALDQDPQVEGALVAIEPETGQVKALVGGVDFQRSQFNRAVLARRQPGSAFKPFIYAAAIEHGYTAATISVQDSPISLPDGRHGSWSPQNFGGRYMGAVTLRTALVNSLNSVSVRLALAIGIDPLRDYLNVFGFSTAFPRNYSLALGSSEVTPFELTRAYGIFATGGRRFQPVFVTAVTDANGYPVDFPGSQPSFEVVMNPATAYIVTQMMESVVETGTATEARKLGRPSAGKTGTTNDSKDAWFVGFTPHLLTSVWVGFDADRALGSYTGGRAATPIWTAFMKQALEGQPERDFDKPDNVVVVKVDAATGLKAVAGRASRMEVFLTGTEPQLFAPRPTVTPEIVDGSPTSRSEDH